MRRVDAFELLIKEYLNKCACCDECIAEYYCIENNLRNSRFPQTDCPEKLRNYLMQK